MQGPEQFDARDHGHPDGPVAPQGGVFQLTEHVFRLVGQAEPDYRLGPPPPSSGPSATRWWGLSSRITLRSTATSCSMWTM